MSDPLPTRTDGWTAARQLAFLDTFAATRSVTKAAAAGGMSRESAHRLRGRRDGASFAALWDIALAAAPAGQSESHNLPLTDRRLTRLLGVHFRRERGDFRSIGRTAPDTPPTPSDVAFVASPERGKLGR
ncbi:MAG: hypothetical protein ABIQ32_10665 [Sphingomicrobium sp.]